MKRIPLWKKIMISAILLVMVLAVPALAGPVAPDDTSNANPGFIAAADDAGNGSETPAATGLADTPWPKYACNANNTGQSPYVGPQADTSLKWTFTGGISGPAIGTDGTLYVGGDGVFYAVDPNETEIWHQSISGRVVSAPAIGSDGTIFFGTNSAQLYALNPNGTVKWSGNLGADYSGSPAIGSDGTVYFAGYRGKFGAYNPENGIPKWLDSTATSNYVRGSPAIGADGTIYIGNCDKRFYAFNPDGTVNWSYLTTSTIGSPPSIGMDSTIYLATFQGSVYAFNPNGTLKWTNTIGQKIYGGPAISRDGTLYIGSTDKKLYALSQDGTLKWAYTSGGEIRGRPTIGADGTVYFGSSNGIVYALNPDGALKWSQAIGSQPGTSGLLTSIGSDGTLYAATSSDVYAFSGPVDFTADQSSGAAPLVARFTATYNSSVLTPSSWSWDFGDGTNSTEQNPAHTYTSPGSYTVRLTQTDTTGTNYSVVKTAYINAYTTPVAKFSADVTNGTAPLNVTFTDLSTDSPTSWLWDFGDGDNTNATVQNPVHTYVAAGTYTVNLTVSNAAGSNTSSMAGYITVSPPPTPPDTPPVVSFTGSPRIGVSAPLTVKFTDTSTLNATSLLPPTAWFWEFGDGTTSTEQNPTHTYTTAGTYAVNLTTTSAAGSSTVSEPGFITFVTPGPIAYNGAPIYVANDGGVKHDINGTHVEHTPNTYDFSFGTGGLNALSIHDLDRNGIIHTTNQSGTIEVRFGGGQPTMHNGILMLAVNGTIPDDFSVHIKASGDTWTLGEPGTSNLPAPTEYTYVEGAVNETFTKDDFIYGPQIWKPCSASNYPLYYGQNMSDTENTFRIMFIDLYSGITWNESAQRNAHEITVEYSFNNLTSFAAFDAYGWYVSCNHGTGIIMTNDLTSSTHASSIMVTGIPGAPVANFTSNTDSADIISPVQFIDTSENVPQSWSWDFGDGTTSTEQNPTHTYTTPGTYTVNLTVTNLKGTDTIAKTDYTTKIVPSTPVADFTANVTSGSCPYPVQFTDQSTGAIVSRIWDFGDGTTSTEQNPVHWYAPGIYSVNLTVTNSGGTNSTVKTDYITVTPSGSSNQFMNPGFESGDLTGWTTGETYVSVSSNQTHSGNNSVFFDYQRGNNYVGQHIDLTGISNISFWAYQESSQPLTQYFYTYIDDVMVHSSFACTSNTWTQYTVPISGYTGVHDVQVFFIPYGKSINAYIDDFVATPDSTGGSDAAVANFTATPTSGDAPLAVEFTDTSSGTPTSWLWEFGDGVNSTEQNPTHTYADAGSYTVNLTATNGDGSNTLSRAGYITVDGGSYTGVLPGYTNVYVRPANHDGIRWDYTGNSTYYINQNGGGLNAVHISTDPAVSAGQVTVSPDQNGTFYVTDTGGRGYQDEVVLLLAVNGTIPDDFSIRIKTSGYTWTPNGTGNTAPPTGAYTYQPTALDETFTKTDFTYGPQNWKPSGSNVWYPIFYGQDPNDSVNRFQLAFIDTRAGLLGNKHADYASLTDKGAVKVEYQFTNLSGHAAFSLYAWNNGTTQGQGMGWTNRLSGDGSSGYTVIPPSGATVPVAAFNGTPTAGTAPLMVQFTDLSTGSPNAWEWDFGDNATSDQQNPAHTYASAGTYSVNLTVTNAAGSNSTVKTDYITVTAPAAPDLTVSTLAPNLGEVFSNSDNTYTAKITNIGTGDAGAFAVGFNVSGVTGTVAVPDGLAAGANATVTWTDETVRTAGENVTVTVVADADGAITEANEEKNLLSIEKTVVANGYRGKRLTGGDDLNTTKTYDVRGDLAYSSGTSTYLSAGTGWTNDTVIWTAGDLAVPPNATITAARLYVPYTEDKGPVFPANVSLTLNGVAVEGTAHHTDEKMWGSSYPYGMTVYDVTGAFSTDGNTAVLANAFPGGGNVSIRGMLLAVVYDDGVTAPHTVLMNEGFDLLYGGAAQSTTPEQATAYAPFTLDNPTGATSARLITVAPGAGPNEGELIFNDETWTDVWNYAGTSQISVDDRNVTALLAGENLAGFRSSADYMEAAAAFLVVEHALAPGSIAVTSTPVGAAVWLDGTETGSLTDCLLTNVPAGDHVVTLTLEGYANATAPVTVASGETATVDLTLTTQTGSLGVTSTPAGAAILIDGADTGSVTNATLDNLAVGTHTVTLHKDGYVDATVEVAIEYNETTSLHLALTEALGSIAVTSAPEGAAIWLDDTDTGKTTNATLEDIRVGEHTITVTKPGYADATATVTVGHGETTPVHFALTVPTGSIAVTSVPDGARVFLDGLETGEMTNTTLANVPAGEHTVRVGLAGYQTAEETVTVTVGGTASCHFNLEKIMVAPVADFNADVTSGTAPLTVAFSDTSTGNPTSWAWDFENDGAIDSTEQNPTFTYTTAGIYTINLTVTNTAGSNTTTKADYITVSNPYPQPLPAGQSLNLYVANDEGVKYNVENGVTESAKGYTPYVFIDNTYHFIYGGSGGGTNALHVSNDPSVIRGQVTQTTNQSGEFWLTFTGGQPNLHDAVLLLAVNGTIPDDFSVRIRSSGYDFEPPIPGVGNNNTIGTPTYVDGAINQTFTREDFIYGPQIWRPHRVSDYPIFVGQDMSDTANTFELMFIDLRLGCTQTKSDGYVRVEYDLNNLTSFAVFNAYGWYSASNHGTGLIMTTSGTEYQVARPVAPVANFTAAPTSGNAPLNVTFTDLSTGSPTSWAWDFDNDGIVDSTEQSPTHIYTTAGTYTVNLTVGNTAGSDTEVKIDYVTADSSTPVANFTATPLSGEVPLTVQFTDASTNVPTAWAWDFGDGTTAIEQNPQHTYTATGTYSVNLTISNGVGTDSIVRTGYIRVEDARVLTSISLSPTGAELKVGARQKFTANPLDEQGRVMSGIGLVWASDNETVGTINGAGMFAALAPGETMITASNGSVQNTANVFVVTASGEQNQPSTIDIPGCNITENTNGTRTVSVNTSTADVAVGGNEIVIREETYNVTITTEGSPEENNGIVNGAIAGIRIDTVPVVTDLGEAGTVSAAVGANLTNIPSGAGLDVTISDNVSTDARSAFELAALQDGRTVDAVAYVMNINRTNLENSADITDATIRMSVSSAWVAAHGGNTSIQIIRWAENGRKEVLETRSIGFDGNMEIFEAASPNGLSLFGLATTTAQPASPSTTSGTSSSTGRGGRSAVGVGAAENIRAGEAATLTFGETPVTEIEVHARDGIPHILITTKAGTKPDDADDPDGDVYEYVSIACYRAPEGSLQRATIRFTVPANWVDERLSSPDLLSLHHYNEETGEWTLLSTVFAGEENGGYAYYADSASFGYFAVVVKPDVKEVTASPEETPVPRDTEQRVASADPATTPRATPLFSGGMIVCVAVALFCVLALLKRRLR